MLIHADEDIAQGGECGESEGGPLVGVSQHNGAKDLEDGEDVGRRRHRAAAASVVFFVYAHGNFNLFGRINYKDSP